MHEARATVETFDEHSLPDLDVVTLAALDLFTEQSVPAVNFSQFSHPLVVGSVNALSTGRVMFRDSNAVFANESDFAQKSKSHPEIDGAFLISASGSKHAVGIAQTLKKHHVPVVLLTNNAEAPARSFVPSENVHVFPKNREPYSYNTSTYMGMLLSMTHENPGQILTHIESVVTPELERDALNSCTSYTFIVPPEHGEICNMLRVKFEELFGPMLVGHAFTSEEIKHAKTIVHSDTECFIAVGVENDRFGLPERRISLALPAEADFVSVMAVAYYTMGRIQKKFPPYFKEGIASYAQELGEMFGDTFNPIVE